MNSIALSAQAFISQNYGARDYGRIKRTFFTSVGIVSVVGTVISGLMVALVYPLINAISGNPKVAEAALNKTLWIGAFYVLCGIMDTMSYSLRGVGKSFTGMVVTLTGTVFFRVLWILFIFPINPTEALLYSVYPITWAITIVTFIIIISRVFKNLRRKFVLVDKIAKDFKEETQNIKLQSQDKAV